LISAPRVAVALLTILLGHFCLPVYNAARTK